MFVLVAGPPGSGKSALAGLRIEVDTSGPVDIERLAGQGRSVAGVA